MLLEIVQVRLSSCFLLVISVRSLTFSCMLNVQNESITCSDSSSIFFTLFPSLYRSSQNALNNALPKRRQSMEQSCYFIFFFEGVFHVADAS